MMTYRLPGDADPREASDIGDLKEQLLLPVDETWATGSGSIDVMRDERMLIIMRNPIHGFVVMVYGDDLNVAVGDVMQGVDKQPGSVRVWCGHTMSFPRRCFVSGTQALSAVEHFLATGEKTPQFEWLDGEQIDTGEPP